MYVKLNWLQYLRQIRSPTCLGLASLIQEQSGPEEEWVGMMSTSMP